MKYFCNRQNPLENVPEDQLEAAFKAIVDCFTEDLLSNKNPTADFHPLQKLWPRKDALASNELFSFGDSLNKSLVSDRKWALDQVSIIKAGDSNNRQGAFILLPLKVRPPL